MLFPSGGGVQHMPFACWHYLCPSHLKAAAAGSVRDLGYLKLTSWGTKGPMAWTSLTLPLKKRTNTTEYLWAETSTHSTHSLSFCSLLAAPKSSSLPLTHLQTGPGAESAVWGSMKASAWYSLGPWSVVSRAFQPGLVGQFLGICSFHSWPHP